MLTAKSAPHANAYLNAPLGYKGGLSMTSNQFTQAVLPGIGHNRTPGVRVCPMPHAAPMPLDELGSHLTNCPVSGDLFIRHADIQDLFLDWGLQANIRAEKEVLDLIPDSGMKPADVFYHHLIGGRDVAVDVTVGNSLNQATLARAAKTAGIVARAKEMSKNNKYRNLVERNRFTFVPVGIESYGALGSGCYQIIDALATRIGRSRDLDVGFVKKRLFQELSIVLQRNNARAVLGRIPPPTPSRFDRLYVRNRYYGGGRARGVQAP